MEVLGISMDDVQSQRKFHEQQELTFSLLSDPDGSVATKYGVHSGRFSSRVTFILDEEGVLRHVDEQVSVKSHGTDLVARIEELRGTP